MNYAHQSRAFSKCKHYNHRAGCPLYPTIESGEDRRMSGRLGKGEEGGGGEAGEEGGRRKRKMKMDRRAANYSVM